MLPARRTSGDSATARSASRRLTVELVMRDESYWHTPRRRS